MLGALHLFGLYKIYSYPIKPLNFPTILSGVVPSLSTPFSRRSPCNWGKSSQSCISITLRSVFISKKLSSSPTKNEPQRMVCSLVKISLDQYEKLDRLRKERKESLSKLIRKALSSWTKKKEHSVSMLPSFLPVSTKGQYKTVTAYFPQHDWNLLETISRNTVRCKTELLGKAVEEYLKQVKSTKDRIHLRKRPSCNR